MHGGAEGSGAPKGNKNALKHGKYTKENLEFGKQIRAVVRMGKKTLQDMK